MAATLQAKRRYAAPTAHPSRVEGDFVVYDDVPIWKEHTNPDGHKFDRAKLERVTKRCNQRIEDNGSFSPLVIGHTDDAGKKDPMVVGFAGRCKLGTVKEDGKDVAAILAPFYVFKEDAALVKRYPRVSVEYWCSEADPYNGYFDPISLLGAETPELDLGIRYSRHAPGQRLIRYSREAGPVRYDAGPGPTPTAPSGSNTFVPGCSGKSKKKTDYAKEPTVALSEEDLQMIVEAMKPVVQAAVSEQIAELKGKEPGAETDVDAEVPAEVPAAAAPEKEEEPDRYEMEEDEDDGSNGMTKTNYAKVKAERDEVRTKYQKLVGEHKTLQTEHAALKTKVETAEAGERKAVRYSKLKAKEAEGYCFDVEEEMKETADLTDAQFERHLKHVERYQRVPLGQLPTERPKRIMTMGPKTEKSGDIETRKRYSKEARDRVLKARAEGDEKLTYEQAHAQVVKENGKSEKEADAIAG